MTHMAARLAARPNTGRFASEDEAMDWVVGRLADALNPLSIWLFGSRSRGTPRPDSDFDLLVVTRVEDGEAGRDYDRVYAPIRGSGVGCDVVPIRFDDIMEELDHPTSMFADIVKNGIRLYGHRTGLNIPCDRVCSNREATACRSS
jgi:predicted nucleotidyltransferase